MPSRSSQQVAMSGPIRGNTTAHAHTSNPHCCACNNAIVSGMNNANSSYATNHGQVGMYHGNVQNHNNHSHIQQSQEMYHNSNERVVHGNSHVQRHHHPNSQHYTTREFQRITKASGQDATQYYICECTSCRNLGNSVDICCQCCNCGNMAATIVQEDGEEHELYSEYPSSRGYTVSSVALTGDAEDTLEVVFDDGEGVTEVIDERQQHGSNIRKINKTCNNVEGHHHVHRDEEKEMADDIAYAHNMAESMHNHQGRQIQKHSACTSCSSCSCSGKPMFQGWSSHQLNSNVSHHQQQNAQQGMYPNKSNMMYHHHHHRNSQGTMHGASNVQQNYTITSPQQHGSQMNSRALHNHHGHPNYNNSHSPNNACLPNQGRANNNGHHPKQFNHRVQKPHSCCSQGNNEPC